MQSCHALPEPLYRGCHATSPNGAITARTFFSLSCPAITRYVENNPVRAKMVRKAWRYPWSSAAAHTGARDATGILSLDAWSGIATPELWKQYLCENQADAGAEIIRARTCRGRPLGSDCFISKLETMTGRSLRPLPHGRLRKGG